MSDAEHQLKMETQLSQLTGKQDRVIDAIQSLKGIAEKAFAPEYTLDELTIPSNIYKDFASYGYLYNYIFVGDSDAGTTLTIGNRIQTHTITLTGGWNHIHLFDNGWWKASNVINVMLLRSKKDMSTYIGGVGSASSPLYASLTGSSPPNTDEGLFTIATIPYSTMVGGYNSQLTNIFKTIAKFREIVIANGMNEAVPSVNIITIDSLQGYSTGSLGIAQFPNTPESTGNLGSIPANNGFVFNSANYPSMAGPVDGFQFVLGAPATAPTTGNVTILGRQIV